MHGHLVSLPFSFLRLIIVSAYRPLSAIWLFFADAHCNPATPIVAHEGGGEGKDRGRWTSCYICNIFAFTIFQLVCILEPLLFTSTLVPSIFFSFFFSPPPSSLYMFEPPLVDFMSFPPPGSSPSRRNSFIRIFTRIVSPQNHLSRARKGFHFLK